MTAALRRRHGASLTFTHEETSDLGLSQSLERFARHPGASYILPRVTDGQRSDVRQRPLRACVPPFPLFPSHSGTKPPYEAQTVLK